MVVRPPAPAKGRVPSPAASPEPMLYAEDRHALAPEDEMTAFPLDAVKPYPDRIRYHVVWRSKIGRTFVAQYAHAPVIPPPPSSDGPVGCDCTDHWGSTRYGDLQADLRAWCPDVFRDGSAAPYTPDVFDGYGPCIQRDVPGLLTEWTDARTIETPEAIEFDAETVGAMAEYREVATDVLSFLGVEEDVPEPPSAAATQEELWVAWATWARAELKLRGVVLERLIGRDAYKRVQRDRRDLWERLYDCGYFSHGPVGAWFARPDLYLAQIKYLLARSVPVLYEWTPSLAMNRSAAFLKPLNDAPPSDAHLPPEVPVATTRPAATARPPPPPCKEHGESHKFQDCASSASAKRKGSDPPPANVDRTKRVVFQEPDADEGSLRNATPPTTPKRPLPTAPHTPIRPLASRFEGVLYSASPRQRSASPEPTSPLAAAPRKVAATTLLGRMTSPSASTISGGASSRGSSPAPADGTSIFARLEQPLPAPALNTIEVIALSDDLNRPLAVETEDGRLVRVEIELLPIPESVVSISRTTRETESALEYRIGGDQLHPRLIIRANGRALEVMKAAEARGQMKKWIECFFVALQHGITVFTGVEVTVTDESIARAVNLHDVSDLPRVNPDLNPPARWATWKDGAKKVVSRTRGFRAAMLRGGIYWRLGRFLYNNKAVESHPTMDVYENGNPVPISIAGAAFYDDWLSLDEERAILGWSNYALPTHLWMWPPGHIWDKYSGGIWTKAHETWFNGRVRDLQTNVGSPTFRPLMTGHDWEQHLRGWKAKFSA